MKRPDVLDALTIPTPCPVAWSSMAGGDRVRFCGQCRKHVYNISNMTRDEALETIASTEGSICVQLKRRPDGTISTGDCWAILRRARRRGLLAVVAVLPLVIGLQLWSMVVGLRELSSFFYWPKPAVTQPPPGPVPAPILYPIVTGGPPPIHELDEIREAHRRRPKPPKRAR